MPLSDIFGTMGQRIVSNEQQARVRIAFLRLA